MTEPQKRGPTKETNFVRRGSIKYFLSWCTTSPLSRRLVYPRMSSNILVTEKGDSLLPSVTSSNSSIRYTSLNLKISQEDRRHIFFSDFPTSSLPSSRTRKISQHCHQVLFLLPPSMIPLSSPSLPFTNLRPQYTHTFMI